MEMRKFNSLSKKELAILDFELKNLSSMKDIPDWIIGIIAYGLVMEMLSRLI